jgi:hypothetical protein
VSEDQDPYTPPETAAPPATSPGVRLAIQWLINRAVVLVALPGLLGMVVALWRSLDPAIAPWTPFAVSALTATCWLPTTVVQLWTLFLAPRTDPRGIVLSSGTRFDRSQFRWQVRAQAVEKGLSATLLLVLAAALTNLASWLLPFALLVVAVAGWGVYFALTNVQLAEATIAHFGQQPERAVELARSVLSRPLMRAPVRDAAWVVLSYGLLRQGDVDGALSALANVRNRDGNFADLIEAQIRVGRGESELARKVLRKRAAAPGSRLGVESLAALADLHGGKPQAVLDRARGWDDLRKSLPAETAAGLALYEAAAHAALGDRDAGRAVLARHAVDLSSRTWMRTVWPQVWSLLEPLA